MRITKEQMAYLSILSFSAVMVWYGNLLIKEYKSSADKVNDNNDKISELCMNNTGRWILDNTDPKNLCIDDLLYYIPYGYDYLCCITRNGACYPDLHTLIYAFEELCEGFEASNKGWGINFLVFGSVSILLLSTLFIRSCVNNRQEIREENSLMRFDINNPPPSYASVIQESLNNSIRMEERQFGNIENQRIAPPPSIAQIRNFPI